MNTLTQAHGLQDVTGLCRCLAARHAAYPQRHGHVVQGIELGQQMVELVNEPQVLVAQATQSGRVQTSQGLT